MTALAFDTLKTAEALSDAGIPDAHARAIVTAMRDAVIESVATKADVAGVKGEIARLDERLERVDERLERLDERLERVDERLAETATREETPTRDAVQALDERLARVEDRLERVEDRLERTPTREEIAALADRLKRLEDTVVTKAEFAVVKWAMGFMAALMLAMAGRLFGAF